LAAASSSESIHGKKTGDAPAVDLEAEKRLQDFLLAQIMSDFVSHECGVALVRLLKPLSYYQEKYGTPLWGFTKLFLLMEKQHNRGQDGAGVACVKLDVPPGEPFMFRERNVKTNPLDKIFKDCSSASTTRRSPRA
jgi:hypothetical protein